MSRKAVAIFAAASMLAISATVVNAMGPGAMGAGRGVSGMGSMNSSTLMNRIRVNTRRAVSSSGVPTSGLRTLTFPTNDPDHYHEIKLIGRLAKDESGLTVDRQIVRMRVDGRTIPMSIDGDAMSNSLQLDQGDELGQTLYRLILSRQLQVVGDRKLRTQITDAAAASRSKPVLVDGFVYDRTTPYLVLVSVGDAP